jgi:hypothetical protein
MLARCAQRLHSAPGDRVDLVSEQIECRKRQGIRAERAPTMTAVGVSRQAVSRVIQLSATSALSMQLRYEGAANSARIPRRARAAMACAACPEGMQALKQPPRKTLWQAGAAIRQR